MYNRKIIVRLNKRRPLASFGLLIMVLLLSLSLAACSASSATSKPINPTAEVISGSAATVVSPTVSSAIATVGPINVSQPVSQQPKVATSADQQESNTVVGVVKQISPAVVTIYNKANTTATSRGRNINPTQTTPGTRTQGIGSGVIISDQGYIVTNAHVVEGEQGLTVAFNNGKEVVTATVVGVDTDGDIAVLKIEGAVPAVAKFGDSSKLQIGETVVAIGAALGDFRNSVTKGVVSGLNRTLDNSSPSVYVQTDAPINHGNSGGPLLNLQGEIIGINTAVLRSTPSAIGAGSDVAEGLGFAIPSNTVKTLSDQLISKGAVTRPYVGITYQMITPALAGSSMGGGLTVPAVEGAWVHGSRGAGVVVGSPAERAGLKDNDVITALDGVALNDNNPLINVMMNYKPGDIVKITVQRGNQAITLTLTLGERPKNLN
ncbi:MAG: trypsin-like peptidase domain-containing protein [Chloroflexota bacterium]